MSLQLEECWYECGSPSYSGFLKSIMRVMRMTMTLVMTIMATISMVMILFVYNFFLVIPGKLIAISKKSDGYNLLYL